MNNIILYAAVPLLACLLFFEKRESIRGLILTKPLLSLLFIYTALMQTHNNMTYFFIVMIGLVLSFIGDVCLIFFFNQKVFMAGLAAFLSAHVIYTAAFFRRGDPGLVMVVTAGVLLFVSTEMFIKLKPHIEEMTRPVLAYIMIITVMAISAATFRNSGVQSVIAGNAVFGAALMFYLSDMFVARHRFVKKSFVNRVISLPLYYAAQFLIAYSTGLV